MSSHHPGFRIFVLGAGFSKPAGLPLASELYREVKRSIEAKHGKETKFQRDLDHYIDYRRACDGIEQDEDNIDLEELMSFLDIEHFLGLRGGDTWSEEGNESQLMIRKAIGEVIQLRTPQASDLPEEYHKFAKELSPHDIVITFNYDIILERALDHLGKPYRLFQHRYKEIGEYSNTVDSDKDEVALLKLHGSVDWFSNKQFLSLKESLESKGSTNMSIHSVFDDPKRYDAAPIVDGPRSPDDPLLHIHRIRDADKYYQIDRGFNAPFLLSPSYVKFVYAPPLLDFWHGLGRAGGYNLGISIIGFSLPQHDEYIRQILYNVISNYQGSWWDTQLLDTLKDDVKFVDFKYDEAGKKEYLKTYGFSNSDKSAFWLEGFSTEAVNFLFTQRRET
ncbi:MAG: SIR2 family protein [Candidatus Thiodiazotropha taylori]|nr:SIR2 family protein [Candidatus Thiodiazotropha taylori]MCG8096750.1 SIR2 family protein [Candidatus Thiodiazotropha endolucinida]MCG8105544.1 SIR2 family protein [Candidatus Thiodiazotropha taylori]MCG8111221.1 SIR2 family protein [Candidatus Thiodiazotropha taylori]MCW4277880.1 SIR2 family protein [Candidatus Thiodiazotropha taylori]